VANSQWAGHKRHLRLPADWPQRRAAVLERDGRVCHICKGPGSDAVDHLQAGDDHSLANLAAVHQDVPPYCHRYKSSAEGGRAKADKQGRRQRPRERHPGLKA
jgi:5-methylcytosine-specific restriction endonuclease McrA